MAAVIDQRLIQGDGTPESVWQAWLYSSEIATSTMESYLPLGVRMVVVAPHPDDEVLACGGLMAMHLARGGDVFVIAVTDGEASHAASPLWDAQSLAATRCAESIKGLRLLGLGDVTVHRLGMPDGQVAQNTLDLSLQLQRVLHPADVVITTWRKDGHPDHDATGLAASLACSSVGCRLLEAPVWMWHWAAPADTLVPWERLQRLQLTPQARVRKQAALFAHASQLDQSPRSGGAVLGASIVQRAHRADEYFFVAEELSHAVLS